VAIYRGYFLVKASSRRSPWIYGGLILTLLALIMFSALPLASSIWQASRSPMSPALVPESQRRLESQGHGYEMVLAREPDNKTALLGLLETRLQQGDLQRALIPLEQLAQFFPEQTEYTILLAQTQEHLKNIDEAIAIYQRVLQSQPANLEALRGLSKLYLAQSLPQQAIDVVQKAFNRSQPNQPSQATPQQLAQVTSLQLLLAEAFLDQNRIPEAITIYENAQKNNPTDFRPLLARAMVLEQQGQTSEAETLFQQALRLAPTGYKETVKKISRQTTTGSSLVK
jgi:tetratricopeptide (TPR) repeat protein